MPKTTDDPSDSASPHAHAPDLFLLSLVHDVTTALISARICYPLSYLLPVRDSAGSRARSISLHLKDLSILGMDGRGGVHDSHLDWVDGSIALEFWGGIGWTGCIWMESSVVLQDTLFLLYFPVPSLSREH